MFFARGKALKSFSFFPSDILLTVPLLAQAKMDDPVLSFVHTWLEQKQNAFTFAPIVEADSFLYLLQTIQHSHNDPNSRLIQ